MTRLQSLFLATTFGLSACGSSSDNKPPPTSTPELNVYTFGQPQIQGGIDLDLR